MASMTRTERAEDYLERLLKAQNKNLELERILQELDNLIYTNTRTPLSKQEKIEIVNEIERLAAARGFISLEHFIKKSATASDNSGIIDVISAMKGRVNK